MSRESFDIIDQTDDVLHEIGTRFDPRFVINSTHTLTSTVTPPCCSNSTRNEDQQNHSLLLGVELTGYHLLNTVVILSFGIPKAISSYDSYRGQSVISTTLDWVAGTLLAVT
jgi:hypothetical protein